MFCRMASAETISFTQSRTHYSPVGSWQQAAWRHGILSLDGIRQHADCKSLWPVFNDDSDDLMTCGDETGPRGGVILYEWFTIVGCPKQGPRAPPYSASQFGPVCWVRVCSSWPQQYLLWWLFFSPVTLSIHFCEFLLQVFEPGQTAGSTITNSNGSHSWIVYGKKKYLLGLDVKLPSSSFICCLCSCTERHE